MRILDAYFLLFFAAVATMFYTDSRKSESPHHMLIWSIATAVAFVQSLLIGLFLGIGSVVA